MIEILTTITVLINSGFECFFTPEMIVCVNETTLEWTAFKAIAGEILTTGGKTT